LQKTTQARLVYGFINDLINKSNEISIRPIDLESDNPKEGSFQFSLGNNTDKVRDDIAYIFKLINNLITIERHYRIKFKNFYFGLDQAELEALELLLLSINNEKQLLKSISFDIDISDKEALKQTILKDEPSSLLIVYDGIKIYLFGETFTVNRKLCIFAPDAIIINKEEILTNIEENKLSSVRVRIKSKHNKLVRYFSDSSPTVEN